MRPPAGEGLSEENAEVPKLPPKALPEEAPPSVPNPVAGVLPKALPLFADGATENADFWPSAPPKVEPDFAVSAAGFSFSEV